MYEICEQYLKGIVQARLSLYLFTFVYFSLSIQGNLQGCIWFTQEKEFRVHTQKGNIRKGTIQGCLCYVNKKSANSGMCFHCESGAHSGAYVLVAGKLTLQI